MAAHGCTQREQVCRAGVTSIFCKGPDSKHFRVCQPCSLCHNFSTRLMWHKSSCRQYRNKWTWPSSHKTLQKEAADLTRSVSYRLAAPTGKQLLLQTDFYHFVRIMLIFFFFASVAGLNCYVGYSCVDFIFFKEFYYIYKCTTIIALSAKGKIMQIAEAGKGVVIMKHKKFRAAGT